MGSKSAPAPQTVYTPPPPPPGPPQEVETQSLRSQLALNEITAEQNRLNMETGAQLDRTNSEFFTGQDIRKVQAVGAEERLSIAARGEQDRKLAVTQGEQQRLGIQTTGEETRKTTVTSGEQQRLGIQTTGQETRQTQAQAIAGEQETQRQRYAGETALTQTRGEQERETIGKSAQEQRTTDLQSEMFRRYKENRDYEQAQNQYRT